MSKPFISNNCPSMTENQSPAFFPLRECSVFTTSEETRKQAIIFMSEREQDYFL